MQIKKTVGKLLLGLTLLFGLGVGADAAPLYLTNANFEIPAGLGVGGEDGAAGYSVPGWTEFEPSPNPWEIDVYRPLFTEGGAQSGSNVLKFIAYSSTSYAEQVLTNTLQNGMRYTLSGWTCAPDAVGNGANFMLYAGTNLLGTVAVATTALNTWTQGTLVFDAGISSLYAGQALKVRIMQGANNYRVFMDNVTLDESPMPGTAATNFDFEIPAGLGLGAQNSPDYSVPGWKEYEPSGNPWEWDIYRPTAAEGGAQSGANVIMTIAYNAATSYLEQVLTNTLQNGIRYTLSGWACDPDGHSPQNGARFFLYAGTNLLGVVTNVPSATKVWNQASFVYDAGSSNAMAGQRLGIRVMQNPGNGYRMFIDNVVLTTLNTVSPQIPQFNPVGGTYYGPLTVTISSDAGAIIHYTTDGSDPTTSGTVVVGATPVSVTAPVNVTNETIKAYASRTGATTNSTVSTASYNILTSSIFFNVQDYGFMFWSNGPAASHYGIKTSRYGMLFNWLNLTPTTLFPISNPSSESSVLTESWAASFPPGSPPVSFNCQVVAAGVTNSISANPSLVNSALIECGKFFQRRWQGISAGTLSVDPGLSGLEVAAWPDRLSFVLRLAPSNTVSSGTLQMTLGLTNLYNTLLASGVGRALLATNGTGFVFLPSAGSSTMTVNPTNATVTVSTTVSSWQTNQQKSVGLIIYPMANNVVSGLSNAVATEASPLPLGVTPIVPVGGGLTVSYDTDRGWYDVILPSPTAGDNGILRAQVAVTNNSSSPRLVRLNFDGVPFNIPGITAVLRDINQNPLGIPVQLSKDWDTPAGGLFQTFPGYWFHGLTMLTVPPNTNLIFELTMAGENWGGLPAATHSQLCVYGYGLVSAHNQQWDESALGNFGESLTYDPEHILTDNDGADSRPILLLDTNGVTGQWCGNFGGVEFLRYYDVSGTQRQHRRMRTQYARYCPNLTEVMYAGQTDDGKMNLKWGASLSRSSDYTRGMHQLSVTVNSNLSFSRLVFCQMPGDTYAYNNGTNLAYGNIDQTNALRQWNAAPGGQNTNIGTAVALTGNQPWVSIASSGLEGAYRPAAKGYVIRSWKSRINGVTNVPPYVVEHSLPSGIAAGSSLDIVPPPGVTTLQAGDYIEAVIERFYVPEFGGDYYGPDSNLALAVNIYPNSYNLALREAIGRSLTVNQQAGKLAQVYPYISIGVTNDFAQFSVTGGLNYVPVTFTGVSTYQSPVAEELVGTNWTLINQSVNGNDFWQANYNSSNLNWDITFNLKMGSASYQSIPALMSNAVTRTFRFRNPNTVSTIPPTPILFTNTVWLGGGGAGSGGFQLGGTGPVGQPWRLFTTTNLASPWAQWVLETSNTFPGSGQFNYTSPVTSNVLSKFYRLISP